MASSPQSRSLPPCPLMSLSNNRELSNQSLWARSGTLPLIRLRNNSSTLHMPKALTNLGLSLHDGGMSLNHILVTGFQFGGSGSNSGTSSAHRRSGRNGANSAFAAVDKLTLRAFDELVWSAAFVMRALVHKGSVEVQTVCGPLHDFWKSSPASDSARPKVKTVDPKSAYKQLPLHPEDQMFCVVSVKRPSDGQVFGYASKVLPFGACASVTSFNRVSRLLQRIMQEALVMGFNYFDDYPLLELSSLTGSCDKVVRGSSLQPRIEVCRGRLGC